MIVHVEDTTRCGGVVDLRDCAVDGGAVAAAVRGEDPDGVAVMAAPAGPVHQRAGYVHRDMSLRTRTALAAAARSRGLSAPQDDERRAIRARLRSMDEPDRPGTASRPPVDDEELARLRERVARLRGRVRTLRECGRDPEDAQADLTAAVRELSERETDRTAREQSRARRREHERTVRDELERRRRLEDRAANLAREARAHLVSAVTDEFERAVAAVPDADVADPFEAPPSVAALAVLRVADLSAPAVIACDRFSSPAAAARWLGTPVIRL